MSDMTLQEAISTVKRETSWQDALWPSRHTNVHSGFSEALESVLSAAETMAKLEEMAAVRQHTMPGGEVVVPLLLLDRLGDGTWSCQLRNYVGIPIYYSDACPTPEAAINAAHKQYKREKEDATD